jgi:hypothetical protein
MPELLFSSETTGCGATIRLDSGEACMVSFAGGGVLVREHQEGQFLGSSFGRKLFEENNPDVVAKIATLLEAIYPSYGLPVSFKHFYLPHYANAIWHVFSLADVAVALDAAASAARGKPVAP